MQQQQQQQQGSCTCQQHTVEQRRHTQQVQHLQLELQRLRQQCKAAWQQVAELKGFLNDYGLVWVGQPVQHELQEAPEAGETSADAANPGSAPSKAATVAAVAAAGGTLSAAVAQLPFDVSELQECLDELNWIAGDGIGQLQQIGSPATAHSPSSPSSSSSSKGKAMQLVTPEPVKLTIYKDGLILHHCPPLPYSSQAADGILSDIFDGYFPSALRSQFPDGMPIQLVDRSNQTLAEAAAAAAAQKNSNIIGWQDLEQQQQRGAIGVAAVRGQALLDRLPKTVIRNQQVVSVRPVVEQFMSGNNSSTSGGSSSSGPAGRVYIRPSSCSGGLSRTTSQGATAAAAALAAGQQHGMQAVHAGTPQQQQQQQQQQATIQVKSEDGKQTYVLVLPYTATIGALRASIDKHRASSGTPCFVCQQQQQAQQQPTAQLTKVLDGSMSAGGLQQCCGYELRSAFPARLYADVSMSLEQAGLVPSATLFMRHTASST
jgi:hypothetical protein